MKGSSHNLDRLRIDFDAPGLVANGGLVLPATLAHHLGLPDEIVVRADSGFYAEKVVAACQAHGARFSISVRLQKSHHQLIAAILRRSGSPSPTGWRAPPTWPRSPTSPSARSGPTG